MSFKETKMFLHVKDEIQKTKTSGKQTKNTGRKILNTKGESPDEGQSENHGSLEKLRQKQFSTSSSARSMTGRPLTSQQDPACPLPQRQCGGGGAQEGVSRGPSIGSSSCPLPGYDE